MEEQLRSVGMDEAGRGSWAGPVVAAAVYLPKGAKLPGLTDSKLLTAKQRETLYSKIIQKYDYGIGEASHKEVDEFGLLQATFLAYERALQNFPWQPDHLLIDGRDKFKFKVPHTSIIKGDQKIRCISAASILAKVYRDELMKSYAKKYPNYLFEAHKGYGTRMHSSLLKIHGPCAIHRVSYKPLIDLNRLKLIPDAPE